MGTFFVAFTDSREAARALDKMQRLQPGWHVVALTAREYIQHAEPELLSQTSDYEGQLIASVYYDSRNPRLNRSSASQTLQALIGTFGNIRDVYIIEAGQANVAEFHIEFCDTRDAENAAVALNNTHANVS